MRVLVIFILLIVSSVGLVEDEVHLESALDHVHRLVEYSPRLAGSGTIDDGVIGGVYSAGMYIAQTLEEYGYTVEIEEFPFTTFQITEFVLIVDFDGDFSTPDQLDLTQRTIPPTVRYMDISHDVTAPLVFPEETTDIGGKIPIFDYWMYFDPQYSDIVGHSDITLIYKENEPAWMCRFRESFSICYDDYLTIKENRTENTLVWVKFTSYTKEVKGFNIIGIKPGGNNKVILTAHYDTVYTDGAIDNGSGVAALLETARILSEKETDSTLYFVFVDAEEIGLIGSEAFVAAHEDLMPAVCINVDSIASGDTVYVGGFPRYEDMWSSYYRTDPLIDGFVANAAQDILGELPRNWYLEDAGGYSDFVSFMRVGIPSTDITTMDEEETKLPAVSTEKLSENATTWMRGGKIVYYHEDRMSKIIPYIHTVYDDTDHFDEELFYKTTQIIVEAAYRMSREKEGVEPTNALFGGVAVIGCVIWYVVRRRYKVKTEV